MKTHISLQICAVWSESSLSAGRNLCPWLSKMCPVKILIRLCQCCASYHVLVPWVDSNSPGLPLHQLNPIRHFHISRPLLAIYVLNLSMLENNSADDALKYFYYFSKINRLWHFMRIQEMICMKCRSLFSGKNKNIIISLSSEFSRRNVKVKDTWAQLFKASLA